MISFRTLNKDEINRELFNGFIFFFPNFSIETYKELSSIHVSEDRRGRGIGKKLFNSAKKWAKTSGADKLLISGHAAVETQSFYKAMGCVEAKIKETSHVQRNPTDCLLECQLLKFEI